jgi:hypothetical protein
VKLISSAETLNFLSKSAPRPWVKRMLKWMIYESELPPYFAKGKITPFTRVLGVLLQVEGLAQLEPGPERDAEIAANFEPEIAKQLIGHAHMDPVLDDPTEWDESEDPHQVSAGFFVFTDELDWEAGTIRTEIFAPESREEHLFWDAGDHLGTQFQRAEYKVELDGLHFPLDMIEMLLPNAELSASPLGGASLRESTIGRPRKWDWEGAFARLAVVAQHPDGLPTGPGAQARIERIVADWFVSETGDSPASSQIRQRAQKMIRLLSVPGA